MWIQPKTRLEHAENRPVEQRFERADIGHRHQRKVVMEQAKAELSGNGLVIWAGKDRLIHINARVRNKAAAGEDYQATGEGERESRGKILHGDEKEMRIFTDSSDSISHWETSRKSTAP